MRVDKEILIQKELITLKEEVIWNKKIEMKILSGVSKCPTEHELKSKFVHISTPENSFIWEKISIWSVQKVYKGEILFEIGNIFTDSEISLVNEKIINELNLEYLCYNIPKTSLVGADNHTLC